MKIKWKILLPIWLVIFIVAPSIWLPQSIFVTKPYPDAPGPPFIIPFGAIHWFSERYFWLERGVSKGEITDIWHFFHSYIGCILPTIIYTFPIALGVYYLFQKFINKREKILL